MKSVPIVSVEILCSSSNKRHAHEVTANLGLVVQGQGGQGFRRAGREAAGDSAGRCKAW